MISQYIELGKRGWSVLIYYLVGKENFYEVYQSLLQLECPKKEILKALNVLRKKNTGFTFTNSQRKMSIVCVGKTTNDSQFVNTAIHEAKHVQSHICDYYNIDESSETAAYLIGYLCSRIYMMLSKII